MASSTGNKAYPFRPRGRAQTLTIESSIPTTHTVQIDALPNVPDATPEVRRLSPTSRPVPPAHPSLGAMNQKEKAKGNEATIVLLGKGKRRHPSRRHVSQEDSTSKNKSNKKAEALEIFSKLRLSKPAVLRPFLYAIGWIDRDLYLRYVTNGEELLLGKTRPFSVYWIRQLVIIQIIVLTAVCSSLAALLHVAWGRYSGAFYFAIPLLTVFNVYAFQEDKNHSYLRRRQQVLMGCIPFLIFLTENGIVESSFSSFWLSIIPLLAVFSDSDVEIIVATVSFVVGQVFLFSYDMLQEQTQFHPFKVNQGKSLPLTAEFEGHSVLVLTAINFTLVSIVYLFAVWHFVDMRQRSAEENSFLIEVLTERIQSSRQVISSLVPEFIAQKLMNNHPRKWCDLVRSRFNMVSVVQSDLVGFTTLSSQIPCSKLVHLLNDLFTRYDEVTKSVGMLKVETIGDAYLAASGCPVFYSDHGDRALYLAQGLIRATDRVAAEKGVNLRVRVGIHSGDCMAAVVGRRMPRYHLFGKTMSIASKMESEGMPGMVQISEATLKCIHSQIVTKPHAMLDLDDGEHLEGYLVETQVKMPSTGTLLKMKEKKVKYSQSMYHLAQKWGRRGSIIRILENLDEERSIERVRSFPERASRPISIFSFSCWIVYGGFTAALDGKFIVTIVTVAVGLLSLLSFWGLSSKRKYESINRGIQALLMVSVGPLVTFLLHGWINSGLVITWTLASCVWTIASFESRAFRSSILLTAFALAMTSVAMEKRGFSEENPRSISDGFTHIVLLLQTILPFSISFFIVYVTTEEYEASQVDQKKMQMKLTKVNENSEDLLFDMLPREIAVRVQNGETFVADDYPNATILFAYAKDYNSWSAVYSTAKVVEVLNSMFSLWDDIVGRHNVYKVETIGEAYLVSSGCPGINIFHADDAFRVALDMLVGAQFVMGPDEKPVRVKVGLNSGALMGGVVGVESPRFRVFGDVVNTASRMASHGEAGAVQISAATYHNLHEGDLRGMLEDRGKIKVKGKGLMQTYMVRPRREKLNQDGPQTIPLAELEESDSEYRYAPARPTVGLKKRAITSLT